MKRFFAIACLSISSVAFAADAPNDRNQNQSGQQSQQNENQTFISQQIGNAEYQIQSGQLAESRVQNANIKSYAKESIDQAQNALIQLNKIGSKPVNNSESNMSKVQQAMISELKSREGKDFERIYIFQQMANNRYNMLECTWQAENCQSPQIKQYAQLMASQLQPDEQKTQQIAAVFVPNLNLHGGGATSGQK